MLLKRIVNNIDLATTETDTKNKTTEQLTTELQAYWEATMLTEVEFLVLNVGGFPARPIFTQAFSALLPTEQDAVRRAISRGLFDGHDSEAKWMADARAACLVLERLNGPANPLGGTEQWLELKKPALRNLNAQALRLRVRDGIWGLQDATPENAALQTVLTTFTGNPLTFVRSVSIHATDGNVPAAPDWSLTDLNALNQPLTARMGFVMRSQNERGALDLVDIASNTRGSLFYFLPWKSKRIIKLAIPAGGPDFFYTAAINGCSVFVTGTTQAPTVYHAGVDGELPDEYKDNSVADLFNPAQAGNAPLFWRRLLKRTANITDGDILGEVNKNHYVKKIVAPLAKSSLYDWIDSTAHARVYEATLQGQPGITPKYASPWGSVFGLRDVNGDWSFYLQENMTIVYEDVNGVPWGTCRPIFVSRFFPTPAAIAQASPSDHANVNPTNLVTVWDGTAVQVPSPFDATSRYIIKNAPFYVPKRPAEEEDT